MDEPSFVKNIKESIGGLEDAELGFQTVLADLAEWDSLAVISTISMFDLEYQVKATGADVQKCRTVGDLATLVEKK